MSEYEKKTAEFIELLESGETDSILELASRLASHEITLAAQTRLLVLQGEKIAELEANVAEHESNLCEVMLQLQISEGGEEVSP